MKISNPNFPSPFAKNRKAPRSGIIADFEPDECDSCGTDIWAPHGCVCGRWKP